MNHSGKEDATQHKAAREKVWYIIKQSFNAKRIVNREEIKPAPMSLHQSGPLHRAHPSTQYASSSQVPDHIPRGLLIPIIVRKLEEGLVLGPAPGRSFPQLSGPARLLMLTVVRGGRGRAVIAVAAVLVGGGGIRGRGGPCSQTSEHFRKSPRVAIPVWVYRF